MLGAEKPALQMRDTFEQKRIAKKIRKRVLFFETPRALRYIHQRPYDDYTIFRRIHPKQVSPFATDMTLYDDTILYTTYSDAYELHAVAVEDKALYTMQKSLFMSLWERGADKTLTHISI
jgi:hypothetical protein